MGCVQSLVSTRNNCRARRGRHYRKALTEPIDNELRPRGVDAFVPIALDRVRSTQLDHTEAPLAALFASCQDAANQVREWRRRRQKAGCIAHVVNVVPIVVQTGRFENRGFSS